MMMEAIRSSETSIISRAALCNIQENGIIHSHRRKNLKSYEADDILIKIIRCIALQSFQNVTLISPAVVTV
jgi:hypothetical protein